MTDPVHLDYRSVGGAVRFGGPVTPAPRTECPVCGKEPHQPSDDHVFPQFLGGKRTVTSCKPCNDLCGHTFEARANERAFLPLYVYLSGLGLTTVRDGREWRKAYMRDGNTYNLVGSDGRMVERLTNPILRRNVAGEIESAQFADARAAREFLRLAKERGQQVRVVEEPRKDRIAEALRIYFDWEWYVQRVALKMALAASVLLPYNETQRTEAAREELQRAPAEDSPRSWPTAIGYADITEACPRHLRRIRRGSGLRGCPVLRFHAVLLRAWRSAVIEATCGRVRDTRSAHWGRGARQCGAPQPSLGLQGTGRGHGGSDGGFDGLMVGLPTA